MENGKLRKRGGKKMFNLREFIKKGLISAVGHMAAYQVILNAAGWLEKGVLTEGNVAEIVKRKRRRTPKTSSEEKGKGEV